MQEEVKEKLIELGIKSVQVRTWESRKVVILMLTGAILGQVKKRKRTKEKNSSDFVCVRFFYLV